jgi:anti-anti-sigma regulatory factor
MWKIQKVAENGSTVWRICGRIEVEGLAELRDTVSCQESAYEKVVLDLQEVWLVDQQAVTFLAACEAKGAQLRNCPSYIREWIQREKAAQSSRD